MENKGYMTLRPRKEKPERILKLFWYQLPNDVLYYLGKNGQTGHVRYRLRSRVIFSPLL